MLRLILSSFPGATVAIVGIILTDLLPTAWANQLPLGRSIVLAAIAEGRWSSAAIAGFLRPSLFCHCNQPLTPRQHFPIQSRASPKMRKKRGTTLWLPPIIRVHLQLYFYRKRVRGVTPYILFFSKFSKNQPNKVSKVSGVPAKQSKALPPKLTEGLSAE